MSPFSVPRWVGAGALIVVALAVWFSWWNARVDVAPVQPLASDEATTLRHEADGEAGRAETRVEVKDAMVATDAPAATTRGEVVVTLRWADDDAPVVGHEVIVSDQWSEGWLHRLDGARTDARGVATLSLAPGDWYVMAESDLGRRVSVRAGERVDVALPLPRGLVLVGRVVDEHDVPVAGATVYEVRLAFGGGKAPVATSAADGTFRAHLVRQAGAVIAHKRGFGASALAVASGHAIVETPIELVLPAATTSLRGRVLDAANQPVPGARVVLGGWTPPSRRDPDYAPAWGEGLGLPETRTDQGGAFAFDDVAVGEGVWRAMAPGRRGAIGRFEARVGVVAEISIVLAEAGTRVLGRVVDREGRPAADVSVGTYRRPTLQDARTSADGRFALDVTPGRVELVARSRALGAAMLALEAADQEQREVELQLRADPVLEGRVIDERGAPLAGLWVETSAPRPRNAPPPAPQWQPFTSAATDAHGRFTLVACAAGPLDVKVREGQVGRGPVLAQADAVLAGGPPITLVVRDAARPSAFVRLRIDDPTHPARQCDLLVSNLETGVDDVVALAAGRVTRLGPMAPGSYRLRHFHVYHPENPILGLQLGPIVLAADEQRDLGTHVLLPTTSLRLTLRRSDGSVPGHVHTLRLFPADGSAPIQASLTALGEVNPPSFRPGRYRVEVLGYVDFETASAEVELREGETTALSIELPALRPCTFQLRVPEGQATPKQVQAQLRTEGGEPRPLLFWNGTAVTGLREGTYTLTLDTEGCRGSVRFTVEGVGSDPLRVEVPVQ